MSRDWKPQQPAIEFEREHRVSGVAGHYKFPDEPGFDRLSLQRKIWDHYDTFTDPSIFARRLQEFNEALSTTGITREKIKANENLASAFRNFIEKCEHKELTSVLGKLEALNPQSVAGIRFDRGNTKHLSDVVHGMVSGFNADDINHYLERFNDTKCLMDLEKTVPEIERRALETKILQKLGKVGKLTVGWVASHTTLERIWEQIKERPLQLLEAGKGTAVTNIHL